MIREGENRRGQQSCMVVQLEVERQNPRTGMAGPRCSQLRGEYLARASVTCSV
jgi:hypothetical protein